MLAAYDFGRFGCLVDVAGGQGAFLAAILAQYPVLRGVLFDQPHVVERAKAVLRAAGVDGRCRVVSGSFFEAIPTSGDAYMLKFILHDNMLVGPGGQERTQEEYASLFALAGFRLVRVTGTASEVSVIEGAAV